MKLFKYIALALCIISYAQTVLCSASASSSARKQEKTKSEKSDNTVHTSRDEMQQRPTAPKMWHSFAAGTAAGLAEVGIAGHALSYVINRTIQGERFTLDKAKWAQQHFINLHPKDVYRGIEVTAAGMAGITALQMSLNSQGQKAYQAYLKRDLTEQEELVPAFSAGFVSALIATPQEGIPNYQQNLKQQENKSLNSIQAVKEMQTKFGKMALWRGMLATGIRDGGFTIGYKVLPGIIAGPAQQAFGDNQATRLGSKVTAGVVTAVMTHPWNVIARHMQNNRDLQTTMHAMRDIYQNQGAPGFFKGVVPRGLRVTWAIPTLSYVEAKMMALLKD